MRSCSSLKYSARLREQHVGSDTAVLFAAEPPRQAGHSDTRPRRGQGQLNRALTGAALQRGRDPPRQTAEKHAAHTAVIKRSEKEMSQERRASGFLPLCRGASCAALLRPALPSPPPLPAGPSPGPTPAHTLTRPHRLPSACILTWSCRWTRCVAR